jgi:hypothetical protein
MNGERRKSMFDGPSSFCGKRSVSAAARALLEDDMKEPTRNINSYVRDPEANPHNLTYAVVLNRVSRLGWSIEEALKTPKMNRSQAGRRSARKSHWSQWNPDWLKPVKKD